MRFTLGLAAALVTLSPALAEPPKPAVVGRAQPVARVLTEDREMLRQAAGPVEAEGPGELFDNADQSLFAGKLYPGRVPEKLLKTLLDEMDQTANGIKGFAAAIGPKHLAKLAGTIFDEGPKLVRRYGETGLKEAAEVGLRFEWDQTTGGS